MKRVLSSLLLLSATQSVLSCDAPSKAGDEMSMQYTGTIDQSSPVGTKGEKFDSSRDRNEPFTFTLGQGQVISGWDNGLVGVCPGDKKILVIQPEDGYGEQGSPPAIPGGAVLNFDVEVVSVNGATADAGSGLSEAHQAQAEGVLNKVNTLLRSNPDSFLDDSDDPLYK